MMSLFIMTTAGKIVEGMIRRKSSIGKYEVENVKVLTFISYCYD